MQLWPSTSKRLSSGAIEKLLWGDPGELDPQWDANALASALPIVLIVEILISLYLYLKVTGYKWQSLVIAIVLSVLRVPQLILIQRMTQLLMGDYNEEGVPSYSSKILYEGAFGQTSGAVVGAAKVIGALVTLALPLADRYNKHEEK